MWWILADPLSFTITLFTISLYLIYYYGTRTYDFWKKIGIKFIQPKYPFLGTTYEVAFSLKTAQKKQLEIYNHFKGDRFGGIFSFVRPVLFIKDPFLIESVLIKDFTSFYNRSTGVNTKNPLEANLVNLEDQQWKSLRAKLSPTFTSGKLKGMHPQLVECADELVKYVNYCAEKSEPLEIREAMAKFTTDVIGSCVFGLNTNALKDPESEFRVLGRILLQPSFKNRLRAALRNQFPGVIKILNWLQKDAGKSILFFIETLKKTMEFREQNNVSRNDFVQLLMELKKQELEMLQNGIQDPYLTIDDNIIVANAFVFFLAGFETTASTLSYCMYELALHQDIQEAAYQHVSTVLKNHNGEVSYEAINDMHLINQIFAETLRLHPPAVELRRRVTKNYVIPGTNITIPEGAYVAIPIYSLHHDPLYFPEPEEFYPDRFSKEKENNIKKGTYLPFGDGPRICIGKRFAKMEMQVALVKLLLNFKFILNPKTISPIVYDPKAFLLVPLGGIWIEMKKRN